MIKILIDFLLYMNKENASNDIQTCKGNFRDKISLYICFNIENFTFAIVFPT